MLRVVRSLCASLVVLVVLSPSAEAQLPGPLALTQLPSLKQLTLEELLQVEVSLPLRDPVPLRTAPAAVTVLTSEDIRRSGATTLPEVLRYAPGLFVGRFSASSWVVSARGFSGTAANKLLVMRDGRTVYSPLFSGVFWDVQDALLNDLARIEITRGPGAALWGSNAVNGVINVVSRPASETQGLYVTGGGGRDERGFAALRYGGTVSAAAFRVFGKVIERGESRLPSGDEAGDGHRVGHIGFRVDAGPGERALTVQGEFASARGGLASRGAATTGDGYLLARWTRRRVGQGEWQLQGYYTRSSRDVPGQIEETRHTVDLDVQHRLNVAGRHRLTWGALYRVSADDTTPALLQLLPPSRTTTLASAFVQDEIEVSPAWVVTLGTRLERNAYTGVEWQPSLRVRWSRAGQTAWAAVARAVRLPTRLETDSRVVAGGVVLIEGNPDLQSERLRAYEAGYRVQPRPYLDVDVAVFVNDYDRLRTRNLPTVAGLPIRVGNDLSNLSRGVELVARFQPVGALRATVSYGFLDHDLEVTPGVIDAQGGRSDLADPRHQLQVHGRFDLPRNLEADLYVRRIGELPAPGAPPWSDVTVRIGWRPRSDVEVSLVGRDMAQAAHREFANPAGGVFLLRRAVFARASVVY